MTSLEELHARLARATPEEIIAATMDSFVDDEEDESSFPELWMPRRYASSASFGLESAWLLDLVTKADPGTPIILIDTGYFPPETYAYIKTLTDWFKDVRGIGLNLHTFKPLLTPGEIEAKHGKLWEQGDTGRKLHNEICKLEPMRRAIADLKIKAIFYGARSEQTDHRLTLEPAGRGKDGVHRILPLLSKVSAEVTTYFECNKVPRHPLHGIHTWVGDWPFMDQPKTECGILTNDMFEVLPEVAK